jgi:hypothetical protein
MPQQVPLRVLARATDRHGEDVPITDVRHMPMGRIGEGGSISVLFVGGERFAARAFVIKNRELVEV